MPYHNIEITLKTKVRGFRQKDIYLIQVVCNKHQASYVLRNNKYWTNVKLVVMTFVEKIWLYVWRSQPSPPLLSWGNGYIDIWSCDTHYKSRLSTCLASSWRLPDSKLNHHTSPYLPNTCEIQNIEHKISIPLKSPTTKVEDLSYNHQVHFRPAGRVF